MIKSRAAMLWGPEDTDWSVEDVEIDEPKGRELLVRNVASGLCHSDEHFITGDMPHGGYPWIAGHEGAGFQQRGVAQQGLQVGRMGGHGNLGGWGADGTRAS